MSEKDSKKNKRGSELESLLHSEQLVTVEKMAVGGFAVARLSGNDKMIVVFIPYGAPGDQLKIKITATEKNFLKGDIIEIIASGNSRQNPACQYFGLCGGCLWQHIDDNEQLLQKELILNDLFKKFLPSVEYKLLETVSAPEKLGYRNRIQLKQIGKKVGYFKHESHDIVEIDNCLIAEKEIQNYIPVLKQKLRDSEKLKKFEIKITQSNQVEHYPVGEFGEGLAFSQVNRFVNEKLVDTVVRLVKQINPLKITELYAGAGNFTFSLAEALPQTLIDAVELSSDLTKNAVERLKIEKKHKQIVFFTTKSETFCTTSHRISSDLVLLDPPRSGCHSDVISSLADQKPSYILYISCQPVNLVRDLQGLSAFYKIEHVQIFDMFPQTDHFETITLLHRI